MDTKTNNESRRRFFAILAAPTLALHHTHTTPMLEKSYLRRIGLNKTEADEFLDLLCQSGRLDEGARAVLETGGEHPADAARRMIAEWKRGNEHGVAEAEL